MTDKRLTAIIAESFLFLYMTTKNKVFVQQGEDAFKVALVEIIRLSGVDPEEVATLVCDTLKESFELPVGLIYQQIDNGGGY